MSLQRWGKKENQKCFVENCCHQIISSHVGPVLFAGDFNTNSKEKNKALLAMIAELKLEEVKFENDLRTQSALSRLFLDHIFCRGLTVESSMVYGASEVKGSDHQPMLVNISVTGQ